MRLSPELLSPEWVSFARNVRFNRGVAETREGVYIAPWLACLRPGISPQIKAWPHIYGASVFRDPDGREWVIVASTNGVWACCDGVMPRETTMPSGIEVNGAVRFTQAFDKLLMWRGRLHRPLVFADLDTAWEPIIPIHVDGTTYANGDRVYWGPWLAVTSVTRSGTTVTVTTSAKHGLVSTQEIQVRGATQTEYNGMHVITVTGDDTFTYQLTTTPATPATGTIQVSLMRDAYQANKTTSLAPGTADWDQVYDVTPWSDSGVYIQNRVAVATAYEPGTISGAGAPGADASYTSKTDYVLATDILDYTTAVADNQMRVTQGDNSEIVDLVPMTDNQLVVFKERSVVVLAAFSDRVAGVSTTLIDNVIQRTLIPDYGATARAWARIGPSLFFMSYRRGVMSMTLTSDNQLQADPIPFSESMQPLIDRIDWDYGHTCRMAYWRNKLWVAIPLDDARTLGRNLTDDVVFVGGGSDVIVDDSGGEVDSLSGDEILITYGTNSYTLEVVPGVEYEYDMNSDYGVIFMSTPSELKTYTGSGTFIAETNAITVVRDPSLSEVIEEIRPVYYTANAVMVYDFENQAWTGYDDGYTVTEFLIVSEGGVDQLFAVGADGYILEIDAGLYNDQEWDISREDGIAPKAITAEVTTGGMSLGDVSTMGRYYRVHVDVSTWNPVLDVSVSTDGVEEAQAVIVAKEFDRTKYTRPYSAPRYRDQSYGDAFYKPYREDYSLTTIG